MKKVMITSRYKLYRKGKFVREVEYQLPVEVAPKNDNAWLLRQRNAEDIRRNAQQCEAFEALADQACEQEG